MVLLFLKKEITAIKKTAVSDASDNKFTSNHNPFITDPEFATPNGSLSLLSLIL